MSDDDNYTGCLLCTRGRFIPGPHPQKVICQIFGIVREREACGSFKGQPIAQVDPISHKFWEKPNTAASSSTEGDT